MPAGKLASNVCIVTYLRWNGITIFARLNLLHSNEYNSGK